MAEKEPESPPQPDAASHRLTTEFAAMLSLTLLGLVTLRRRRKA